jgi:hypothetical protein
LAKFQQQRTDALLGVLGEVLSKGDAVGQPTLRSWLLDDPNAVFSPGKEAEGKKEKRKEPAKGKKLLTAPTLLEMAG